jgi:hypothetical protein
MAKFLEALGTSGMNGIGAVKIKVVADSIAPELRFDLKFKHALD